jgi:hypothetical protein
MIIYGEIIQEQEQMNKENDHVLLDIMCQRDQNGYEYILHDNGEIIE